MTCNCLAWHPIQGPCIRYTSSRCCSRVRGRGSLNCVAPNTHGVAFSHPLLQDVVCAQSSLPASHPCGVPLVLRAMRWRWAEHSDSRLILAMAGITALNQVALNLFPTVSTSSSVVMCALLYGGYACPDKFRHDCKKANGEIMKMLTSVLPI